MRNDFILHLPRSTFLQKFINDEQESEDESPEFRYLSSDCGIQPNKRNNYGIPEDVINMFQTSQSENMTYDSTNTIDDVISNKLESVIEISQKNHSPLTKLEKSLFQVFLNQLQDEK